MPPSEFHFMQSLVLFFRRPGRWASSAACLLCLLGPGAVVAQTNVPPTIITQPVSGMAGVGEDFAFSVVATNTTPLSYQWYFNTTNMPGKTASILVLTNLASTNSGFYNVIVTSAGGSVVSSFASLTVLPVFPRRFATERLVTNSSSQVAVPITLRASGRENAVSFSLAYNTNAFANPVFIPGYSGEAVTANLAQPGIVGFSLMMPPGQAFPAGYASIGLIQFDLAAGSNPLQGGLAFTNSPMPIAAANEATLPLIISAAVQPQYVLVTSAPKLDRQSGLFTQQIVVGNPGAALITNIDVLALNLGADSLTNTISFYNSVGNLTNVPYGDPLVEVACNCGCGYTLQPSTNACDFTNFLSCATSSSCSLDTRYQSVSLRFAQTTNLAPAESRTLTLEFYVSDHLTVPPVRYSLYVSPPKPLSLPDSTTPLTITATRYFNGSFIIQFPTLLGRYYYVQYADNPLLDGALTAFPPVPGTGNQVQWVDDVPPKTISPPVDGSRFYRVLQGP